jgi:hypothetical protein
MFHQLCVFLFPERRGVHGECSAGRARGHGICWLYRRSRSVTTHLLQCRNVGGRLQSCWYIVDDTIRSRQGPAFTARPTFCRVSSPLSIKLCVPSGATRSSTSYLFSHSRMVVDVLNTVVSRSVAGTSCSNCANCHIYSPVSFVLFFFFSLATGCEVRHSVIDK